MSIYRCWFCECYKDADYDGCNKRPNDMEGEICDKCNDELEKDFEYAMNCIKNP